MLNRYIEPASAITFRADHHWPAYAVLTMAQVERLRANKTYNRFIARARREFFRT